MTDTRPFNGYAKLNELECFSNLLLRWPYDTPMKLFFKISSSNFYLYEFTELYFDNNKSAFAKLIRHEDNENKFDYLIDKYEYLFFMKEEIKSVEYNDDTITLRPSHTPEESADMCTEYNIGTIAAKSINAICVQDCGDFVEKEGLDTYRIEGVLQFGTRNRIIPAEKLWPRIPYRSENDCLQLRKTELHEDAARFIEYLRLLGQRDTGIIAKETKTRFPKLNQTCLGRLISPPGDQSTNLHTFRQRGRRALNLVP